MLYCGIEQAGMWQVRQVQAGEDRSAMGSGCSMLGQPLRPYCNLLESVYWKSMSDMGVRILAKSDVGARGKCGKLASSTTSLHCIFATLHKYHLADRATSLVLRHQSVNESSASVTGVKSRLSPSAIVGLPGSRVSIGPFLHGSISHRNE